MSAATSGYLYHGLSTCLEAAAREQGRTIRVVSDPTPLGRLMWAIDGGEPLTPGEAAAELGIPAAGRYVVSGR